MHVSIYVECHDRSEVRLYDEALIETCHYQGQTSVSDSISAIEALNVDSICTVLTTFTICSIVQCRYWGYGKVFYNNTHIHVYMHEAQPADGNLRRVVRLGIKSAGFSQTDCLVILL